MMTQKLSIFFKSFPFVFFAGLLLLSSCTATSQKTVLPIYETTDFQSLRLDARKMEIIENWNMPMEPPYIEHTLLPNLSNMLVDWASRVLIPVGGSGEVVLDISQASVKITSLPRSEKLIDLFKDNQEVMVRADIKAKLIWIQPVGGKQAIIDLSATASSSMKETSTPNEREIAIREVMIEAVNLINQQAEVEIRASEGLIRS
ncbi:MAG: hypothetical protein ACPHP5_01245 [Candidatus Puniceispirillaceae bacterium]